MTQMGSQIANAPERKVCKVLFVCLFYAFEIEEETEDGWRRESSREGFQDTYKDDMLAWGWLRL